jgi:multidrug efflux pump subunit AcrA (membrane-fusion protein)
MPEQAALAWVRRPDLVVRPVGDDGQHVVKDPATGEYYHLGEQEAFLLLSLDGSRTPEAVCAAFAERFGEPLSKEDLGDFLEAVGSQGLLQELSPSGQPSGDTPPSHYPAASGAEAVSTPRDSVTSAGGPAQAAAPRPRQSILFWRKPLFDPDRFLTWLAPKLALCYTRAFVVVSLAAMGAAAFVAWANREGLVSSFQHALRWETVVVVWVTLLAVTACHEVAHGLTCKRFGGEVHEIGFLLLLLLPCLYCNVSDTWLFKEKSKRLWVTLAGGYWDLCLWAVAVLAWRVTVQDGFANYLAFVLLSVLGVRVFFNFNPLLRLDGYYLLSDLTGIRNLQPRALAYFKGHVRWLLWGAPRPEREERGRFLLIYGVSTWAFSVGYLALMLAVFAPLMGRYAGTVGVLAIALLGVILMRAFFRGLLGGEVRKMLRFRHRRTVCWLAALGAVVAALCLVHMEDRAGGPFQVRPLVRAEIRAPVAGFLQAVALEEGSRVRANAVVARIEVPNLATRIAQKQAEVRELEARLRLLEAGPRLEELRARRRRAEWARACCRQAEENLQRARRALDAELAQLDRLIDQHQAEVEFAAEIHSRALSLRAANAISAEQCREAEKRYRTCQAQLEQARSQRHARQTVGPREAETELARRRGEVAEAESALALAECGPRPEEVEAQRAILGRVREEVRYLESLREKAVVRTPVAGLVTTPRLADKVGQYLREGEVICLIEEPSLLEAEVVLPDQELARVRVGQEVELTARAHPFEPFRARVDRIAPRAVRGELHSTVTVYTRVEGAGEELRPGMVGHARIACGRRPVGAIWVERFLRFLRTEFW